MTYIVALKQSGFNAIISDARVSWTNQNGFANGKNVALKTGVLFPGCIFGRLGDDDESTRFILQFRASIKDQPSELGVIWGRFCRFIELYEFPKGETHFELLISTRGSGTPEFFLVNSKGLNKLDQPEGISVQTFGSGKEHLDQPPPLYSERISLLNQFLIRERNFSEERAREIVPYFLCLWLSELSLTFERGILEESGVGGLFSFIAQTPQEEIRQGPTIFVFSAADLSTGEVFSWVYRMAYLEHGLYIEDHVPPGEEVVDPDRRVDHVLLWHPASDLDEGLETDERISKAKAELPSLPFFVFCGLGYTEERFRQSFVFLSSTNGRREELFDEDGSLSEQLKTDVELNFQAVVNNRPT